MKGRIKMKPLKIGVIGTGNMGKNHVRNIAQEKAIFELVGIYDASEKQAELISSQYGTKAFSSPEELLKQVEAAVIAVPSSLHRQYGLLAAEYGVHALIEKPLATNSRDAREIAEAFKNKGLKLAVGHIERFNSVIIELKKILDPGEPFFIEARRYSPFSNSGRITDTSVVEDLMIHDVDLVCYLLGNPKIVSVHGFGESVRSGNTDFATGFIRFDSNVHAVISASRVSQDKERVIKIHTENSSIRADLLAKTLIVSKNTGISLEGQSDLTYKQDGVVQKIFVPIQEPLRTELIAFHDSVVNDTPIVADGEVGIRAVELCEQIVSEIKNDK